MPVRSIPASRRSLTGRIAGTKCIGEAAFESTLERDLLLVLEFAPAVTAYEVQPVRISYIDKVGRNRSYTPDVLIHGRHAGHTLPPLLCEIKHRADAQPPGERERTALLRKLRAARRYAADRGWCFRLLTERHIRSAYLHNARFLLPFRTHPARPERLARILDRIEGEGSEPADDLLGAVAQGPARGANSDYSWCIAALWHLLATSQLLVDHAIALTMQTRIYHPVHRAAASLLSGPAWLVATRPT
ncbi:MAG: TnsA endonuclease N-terminal domain-containing protein [Longimicrobiales bacterium]